MAKESSLEFLSAASRVTNLTPDAANSLNALSFKIASEKRIDENSEGSSRENDKLLKRLQEKANRSLFLD